MKVKPPKEENSCEHVTEVNERQTKKTENPKKKKKRVQLLSISLIKFSQTACRHLLVPETFI